MSLPAARHMPGTPPEVVNVEAVDVGALADAGRAEVAVHVIPVHQLGGASGGLDAAPVGPDPGGGGRPHERLAELLVVVVGAGRPDALQVAAVLPVVLNELLRLPKAFVGRSLEVGLGD